MEQLRQEILQAEQTRSDLLKLKLSLVGTIGALGLGFSGSRSVEHAELVLAVIPLVCVYVDLLCRHLSLRIVVIGAFLRSPGAQEAREEGELTAKYEKWAESARRLSRAPDQRRENKTISAFDLEDWALEYSTT